MCAGILPRMDTTFFLYIFGALSFLYLYLGYRASKGIKNRQDYFLAGRNLGYWGVTFTLVATQLGGGVIIGTSDHAYSVGIYGILYTVGICLGFGLLACGFASKLRSFEVSTTAELFEKKYGSPSLRKIASVISVVSMTGLLIGQVVASRRFMVGLGVGNEAIVLAFWAFVILYTVMGGLKSVVVTDIAQVTYIIVVMGGVFVWRVIQNPDSLVDFFSEIWNPSIYERSGVVSFDQLGIVTLLVMPMLFSLVEQDLAQRCFAARSRRIATLATASAGIFLLAFACIPVFFGIEAHKLAEPVPEGSSVFMVTLSTLMGPYVTALVACGLLAAIVSTADSLLCAISSNVAQDFEFAWIQKLGGLRYSRLVTTAFGILAVVLSYGFNDVLAVLVHSYGLLVSCLLVSVLFCFFQKQLSRRAAYSSVISGLVAAGIFWVYPIGPSHELATLSVSLLAYLVGYFTDNTRATIAQR